MTDAAPVLFAGASASAPIQLSGPPRRVAGQVSLRNPQARSLVLRDASFTDRSGRLAQLAERHTFAPVVLRPAEERAVHLVIGIDPTTSPGEYRVDIDVMGQVRPAVLNVAQSVALRVEPKRVVLMNELAGPWRAHVLVTNEGNVPLSINPVADVELRDDVVQVRDLRGVIAPLLLADLPRDLDDFVAVLLGVLPAQGPVVTHLSVRTDGAPVELAPGQSARLELEITPQERLPANGRFRGRVPVLTEDLEFVVVTPAGPAPMELPPRADTPKQPVDTRRRPAKASGRRKK